MDKERRDFFVSYTSADKDWASWIAETLESAEKEDGKNYTCYIQAFDFKAGDNFVSNMHNALQLSDNFIAVMSENYFKSFAAGTEWTAAFKTAFIDKSSTDKNYSFFPVKISNAAPEGLFGPIVYIDLFEKDEEAAKKILLESVSKNPLPRKGTPFPGKSSQEH